MGRPQRAWLDLFWPRSALREQRRFPVEIVLRLASTDTEMKEMCCGRSFGIPSGLQKHARKCRKNCGHIVNTGSRMGLKHVTGSSASAGDVASPATEASGGTDYAEISDDGNIYLTAYARCRALCDEWEMMHSTAH